MHWPRLTNLSLAALLTLGTAAHAEQVVVGEQLYLLPPKGWIVAYHDRPTQGTDQVDVTELVPAGQTIKNWTEMLVVQMVMGKPSRSPQDYLNDQLAAVQEACEEVGAGAIIPTVENGYDTAQRPVACTRGKRWGKGEFSLYKVIRGHERSYVISRAWRGEPFAKDHAPLPAETLADWKEFLRQAVVCDSRDALHPCPKAEQK